MSVNQTIAFSYESSCKSLNTSLDINSMELYSIVCNFGMFLQSVGFAKEDVEGCMKDYSERYE